MAAMLLLLAGCTAYHRVQPCAMEPAMSICDVIGHATTHNDTEVTVRGKYQATPEYSLLFADECHGFVNLRLADDYKESALVRLSFRQLLRRSPHAVVQVVARGTFREAGQQECFGGGCASYNLMIHEFLCVSAMPKQGRRNR
jgi:hypothetical protein